MQPGIWIDIAENFKLLVIDFNNRLEEEDIKERRKVVIKGMNNNYKQQLEKMRKEMFAWYKVRLPTATCVSLQWWRETPSP